MIPVKLYNRNNDKLVWEGTVFELPQKGDKIIVGDRTYAPIDYRHTLTTYQSVEIGVTPWRLQQ